MKMEVFVPMKWHLVTRKGMRIREEVPFIQDLLFVHETQNNLDAVVEKIPTPVPLAAWHVARADDGG